MNYLCTEKDQQLQTTLYFNDRPYRVLDIGEGTGVLVIVDNIPKYMEKYGLCWQNKRLILVDVFEVIQKSDDGAESIIQKLTEDLHLLLDVFWLEDVQIESEVEYIDMAPVFSMVNIRNSSMLQRPLSQC